MNETPIDNTIGGANAEKLMESTVLSMGVSFMRLPRLSKGYK